MKSTDHRVFFSALLATVALLGLALLATSQVTAQRPEVEFKVGDHVEVDTLYSKNPEKSVFWKKGTIVKMDDPKEHFGSYTVKLDQDGSLMTVRFIDTEWIRPAQSADNQPADKDKQPQAQPEPSAANGQLKQLKYKVGQRVEYVYDGKWYKAIIIKVRDDSADHLDGRIYSPYRIHPLGYNGTTDTWVCCADDGDRRTQLRPAGSGPTEPVPGGEANDEVLKAMRRATTTTPTQPPAKPYHCVYFVVDHLVDAAPFTITSNNTYKDSDGKRGTYSFNSASSTLTFHGGNYDGQRAEYETSGGQPQLHILGPSGRPVIDCD
jgi:hypothetical protein